MSLNGNVSVMVGKRDLPGCPLTMAKNLATILAIWRHIEDSGKCDYFHDISIRMGDSDFSRDFHVTLWPVRETIKSAVLGS